MSRENVEVVMKGFEAFQDSRTELLPSLWHEDIMLTVPEGWPETGPFEGRDAVLKQFERVAADWSEMRFTNMRGMVQLIVA